MLLQSAAMVAKKLPVDDKIAACVKQICLLGVFAFLKNGCYQYLNFVLRVLTVVLRTVDWPTANFLGRYFYFPVIRLVNFV